MPRINSILSFLVSRSYYIFLILVSILFVGLQFYIFRDFIVPPGHDIIAHSEFVQKILNQDPNLSQMTYPSGMHYTIALFSLFIPWEIPTLILRITILLSPILFWGTFLLFKEYFKSNKNAIWATLGALCFSPAVLIFYHAGLYPTLWSLYFLPLCMFLNLRFWEKPSLIRGIVGFIPVIGLFLIHPSGLINFILYQSLLIFSLRKRMGGKIDRTELKKIVGLLGIASIFIGIVSFSFLRSGLTSLIAGSGRPEVSSVLPEFNNLVTGIWASTFGLGLNTFVLLVPALCLIFMTKKAFRKNQMISFPLLSATLFLLIFIDSICLLVLKPVFVVFFPWGEYFRVWAYLIVGFSALAGLVGPVAWENSKIRIVLVIFLAFSCSFVFYLFPLLYIKWFAGYVPLNQNDRLVFDYIKQNVPPESIIINDYSLISGHLAIYNRPVDGGVWIPFFTERKILFPYSGAAPLDFEESSYIIAHLIELGQNEKLSELVQKNHIEYIYFGSRQYAEFKRSLNINDLSVNSNLRLVYKVEAEAGEKPAYLFQIKP